MTRFTAVVRRPLIRLTSTGLPRGVFVSRRVFVPRQSVHPAGRPCCRSYTHTSTVWWQITSVVRGVIRCILVRMLSWLQTISNRWVTPADTPANGILAPAVTGGALATSSPVTTISMWMVLQITMCSGTRVQSALNSPGNRMAYSTSVKIAFFSATVPWHVLSLHLAKSAVSGHAQYNRH